MKTEIYNQLKEKQNYIYVNNIYFSETLKLQVSFLALFQTTSLRVILNQSYLYRHQLSQIFICIDMLKIFHEHTKVLLVDNTDVLKNSRQIMTIDSSTI